MNVNKGFVDVKGEFNAEESVMFFIWEKSVKYGASFIFFSQYRVLRDPHTHATVTTVSGFL